MLGLIGQNLATRKARTALTAAAVAIGIMTVVALGVLTFSLKQTAISILRTGKADFTVAQKGVSDLLYSAVNADDLERIRKQDGIESAIGVLVAADKLDSDHPLFLRIGIDPSQLAEFGVKIVKGRPHGVQAKDEILLGYRAARDLHKDIGDKITVSNDTYTVVGIYDTGQVFGDSASMLALPTLQAAERKGTSMTLIFVRAKKGFSVPTLRKAIENDLPQLATVQTETDFGRVDRNLLLINAANLGGSILALVLGAIGVANTTLLSFFERTREFGVLRAIGWSRFRLLGLVFGEAVVVSLAGAIAGIALGFLAIELLRHVPDLIGVFRPQFTSGIFWRALGFALAMSMIGALYPAARAARLVPLEALRHE